MDWTKLWTRLYRAASTLLEDLNGSPDQTWDMFRHAYSDQAVTLSFDVPMDVEALLELGGTQFENKRRAYRAALDVAEMVDILDEHFEAHDESDASVSMNQFRRALARMVLELSTVAEVRHDALSAMVEEA